MFDNTTIKILRKNLKLKLLQRMKKPEVTSWNFEQISTKTAKKKMT